MGPRARRGVAYSRPTIWPGGEPPAPALRRIGGRNHRYPTGRNSSSSRAPLPAALPSTLGAWLAKAFHLVFERQLPRQPLGEFLGAITELASERSQVAHSLPPPSIPAARPPTNDIATYVRCEADYGDPHPLRHALQSRITTIGISTTAQANGIGSPFAWARRISRCLSLRFNSHHSSGIVSAIDSSTTSCGRSWT